MATVAPYGSWKSPISPGSFALGNCKAIVELRTAKDGIFYVEQSATTGKRELYHHGTTGRVRWAPEQSVQNSVHEYGGGAFMPTSEGGVIFSTVEGLFEQKSVDTSPCQLVPALDKRIRFADFAVTSTHIFCVNECHVDGIPDPINQIISVNRSTGQAKVVASGADFYAAPRVSPDGKRIAWMQWNHINMPWDETSIHMACVNDDGSVANDIVIKDGRAKNINYAYPNWASDETFYVVHDSTNFWNLYHVYITSDFPEANVYPVDKEIGFPHWQFGNSPYAAKGNKIVLIVGDQLMLREGDLVRTLKTPGFSSFSHPAIDDNDNIYVIASGPTKSSSIIRIISGEESKIEILRRARDDVDQFDISEPQRIVFDSDGEKVTGFYYPPYNKNYVAPEGTCPPVILLGHGGPTGSAYVTFDLKKQFFTSRGFAIFDVDYRGSTGYGSKFRHMLKRQWGIVDRNDMINGAKVLVERKLADKNKICIMGSSAGGYLVLSALIHSDIFAAAVSVYGVADLVALGKDTHKFEKGYNEVLIGKYPEEEHIYKERSPINHLDRLRTPIAFLHGKEDTVVDVSQSIDMYEKMKGRNVVTALQLYPDEGHGFRGQDAVKRSTEASYFFFCKVLGIPTTVESDLEIVNLK